MRIPICGQHYRSRSTSEQKINLYPEVNRETKEIAMYGTEGMDLFCSLGGYPMRGFHKMSIDESKLFAVSGGTFYKILPNGTNVAKGTLNTSEGLVSMADNGLQILIVDGSQYGYIYTLATDTLVTISDPDFKGGKTCKFIDGYFIINMIDNTSDPRQGQRVQSSALYDGLTWNALDIAEAEGDPDPIIALSTNFKQLWIHGSLSTEIWYDAENPVGFPFSRMQGGVVEYGLSARWGITNILGKTYLIARTNKGEKVIIGISGYQPNIVSHSGINYEISQIENVADCEAFSYDSEGHSFVVFTFPSGDLTLVFDASNGMWHRRKSYGMGRWRARCYAFFNGMHLVGDFQNGNIYRLNMETCTENGFPIERIAEAREIIDKNDRDLIYVHEIQLDIDLGVGTDGLGQGTDPQAIMECSRDHGKTWGSRKFQPLMRQGKFRSRLMWHRWGRARRRIFKLTITDPVKIVLRGASIEAEKGIS